MKPDILVHQGNVLTPTMRAWLGRAGLEKQVLLWEMMQRFMKQFNLTRDQAGRLMQQWIQETC